MQVLATRDFVLTVGNIETPVYLSLFAPEHANTEWICVYEIVGVEWGGRRSGRGEDAMQSLLVAMQKAAIDLYTSEHWKRGELTWDGNKDLGLPLPDGFKL